LSLGTLLKDHVELYGISSPNPKKKIMRDRWARITVFRETEKNQKGELSGIIWQREGNLRASAESTAGRVLLVKKKTKEERSELGSRFCRSGRDAKRMERGGRDQGGIAGKASTSNREVKIICYSKVRKRGPRTL